MKYFILALLGAILFFGDLHSPAYSCQQVSSSTDSLKLLALLKNDDVQKKIRDLPSNKIDLTPKDEKYLFECIDQIEQYLIRVGSIHDKVDVHMILVFNAHIYDHVEERVRNEDFVSSELRNAVSKDFFSKRPSPLSSFLQSPLINDVRRRGRHPIAKMRKRIVASEVTEADLFYLLTCYRVATIDYSKLLDEEAEFDQKLGLIEFSEIALERDYLTFEIPRPDGRRLKIESRGHIYLPRLHQKKYKRDYGPRQFDDSKSGLGSRFFLSEKPRKKVPFITTGRRPAQRDQLQESRTAINLLVPRLKKLMGEKWAGLDLKEPVVSGVDTYFAQRVLTEELKFYLSRKRQETLNSLVKNMLQAKSHASAANLLNAYLDSSDANKIAIELRTGDKANSKQLILDAISEKQKGSTFAAPPKNLVEAAQLISEAEHLAAVNKKPLAVDRYSRAADLVPLSPERIKRFQEIAKSLPSAKK